MNAAELEKFGGTLAGVAVAVRGDDELVLSVAGHAFATLCLCGPERGRLSFAVEAGHFVELTARAGIVPAHYTARPFWITLIEPERFGAAQTQAFVRRSYELVREGLSKRQQVLLAARESAAPKKRAVRKRKD
ncbi:MAG: MmcQ/YjbR family DNA-binding protein [Xanthomonadaceae bacterium]|nr:MmcQ/YjbR family DNA-binding protein [Xanthomonadaceae bacterium]MDE1884567.1 MmcQ/YjbR family DNA-binding protein [Xanthomonadaceae bacterium]MDE1960829.1 MmcQ/YjbR family DNA-binding protein [Xanthomonadaceae bacterium]MDE2084471.1 MmcQ/YjbR family DNA-binding protein [Xanthomonadaceae bacterium]MDE2258585.1 MmcQ/YjbR family DNA-binding protein [Xanthomonadaceae bacterium]